MFNYHKSFEDSVENIDASLFSGDFLEIEGNLEAFEETLERWKKAVEEQKSFLHEYATEKLTKPISIGWAEWAQRARMQFHKMSQDKNYDYEKEASELFRRISSLSNSENPSNLRMLEPFLCPSTGKVYSPEVCAEIEASSW